MKSVASIFVFAFVLTFTSCKHEAILYEEYKAVPVIYGLLDARADTNYIKITRVFYAVNDDATQIAMNPDSSNYPGKLDVRLTEFCNGDSVRQIILDTITIHNKPSGTFYAPKQKLYYTAEPLCKNTKTMSYRYRLSVVLPDKVIFNEADIVGSEGYRVKSLAANFSQEYFGTNRPLEFYPAINATSYDITMSFTFKEQRTPYSDSVPRTMYWKVNSYDDYYLASHIENGYYHVSYRPEQFHEMLRDFIGGDTAIAGLTRYIGDYPVEIIIDAAGDHLSKYIQYGSFYSQEIAGDDGLELIDGALGVFSSRMTASRRVRLAGLTLPELVANPAWGFKFCGGD